MTDRIPEFPRRTDQHPMCKPFSRLVVLAIGCTMLLGSPKPQAADPNPDPDRVRLIFDTDICGDCDDVLALGMIHTLQSRGLCSLLAVTISADHDLAAPFVDAVNNFYGRGAIPIGVVGKGGVVEKSEFLSLVEEKEPDGRFRYPHDLLSSSSAPRATDVLRATLANQPDRSVAIVQVGFSTNLARLLDSPPDRHSPLSGRELVERKVRLLSLMAGAFQPIEGNPRYREYNVAKDVASARTLAARWPTPIVYSGFEIGIALPYPAISVERDYRYVKHHPLAEA
jgi:purine nucleosidase